MKMIKTSAGAQALAERDKRLSSKLRMLLVTVDGSHDEASLRQIAANIGAPADAVEQLRAYGLIEGAQSLADERAEQQGALPNSQSAPVVAAAASPDEFSRFRIAAGIMNELASDCMGLKAVFFVLKVERCGTLADLAALYPSLEPSVIKAHGDQSARLLLGPLKELIQSA